MTAKVTTFTPRVRLKTIANEPGGLRLSTAILRAESAMEAMRDSSVAIIDDMIAEMQAMVAAKDPETVGALYRKSNELFGLAGTFGLGELSAAAFSLCTYIEAHRTGPSPVIMKLHTDTMRALQQPALAGNPAARRQVLDGLSSLVQGTH